MWISKGDAFYKLMFPALILSLFGMVGGIIPYSAYGNDSVLIDTVVASVNGEPITLRELQARVHSDGPISLQVVSTDPEMRYALDQLINERLLAEEAKARNIAVDEEDLNIYIAEVAERNGMAQSELETAVTAEGMTWKEYLEKIRSDILKSKLAASVSRDGAAVTEEDIDQYLEEHPELSASGSKVKLRQISVFYSEGTSTDQPSGRSKDSALQILNDVAKAVEAGSSFEDLAKRFSESPEAQDGGLLGILREKDLSPIIADAILLLEEGEVSPIVTTPSSMHLFLVEERFKEHEDPTTSLRAEVRAILSEEKLQSKLANFFTLELPKQHRVERKI